MSVELDMRHAVVESGRKSCGVRLAILDDRLWRATERDTARNILGVCVWRDYSQQNFALYLGRMATRASQ